MVDEVGDMGILGVILAGGVRGALFGPFVKGDHDVAGGLVEVVQGVEEVHAIGAEVFGVGLGEVVDGDGEEVEACAAGERFTAEAATGEAGVGGHGDFISLCVLWCIKCVLIYILYRK